MDWDEEKSCFEGFLRELAFFYSPRSADDRPGQADGDAGETEEEVQGQLWQLEHVFFPSLRRHTAFPRDWMGREVQQVANLPDLFRVFERC